MDPRLRHLRGPAGDEVELDCPPGFDPGTIPARLHRWAGGEAMRDLVGAFGGRLPRTDTAALLAWLDDFSDAHWNFRGRLGGVERDRIRVDLPPRSAAAARTAAERLGLTTSAEPPHDAYAHVLVLGGLGPACLQRTECAARLAATRTVGAITALGSLRPLGPRERAVPGLEGCRTEADALAVGLRGAGSVLVAPPRQAGAARANTADTYAHWAASARPRSDERILVVTSPIYVPFQHCDAIRMLGLRYRCGIDTVGFDPRRASLPPEPGAAGADRLLQEIRSAIRAARALHAAVA